MVRIMPLGDSITFGVVNNDTNNEQGGGYRTVLYDQLLSNGFTNTDGPEGFNFVGLRDDTDPRRSGPNGIDRDHGGYRGWTIDELINGRPAAEPAAGNITTWLATEVPEVVMLMIGTNDMLDGQDAGTAINELSTLIDLIINTGAKALVASIPPLNPASPRVDQASADNAIAFNAAIPGLVATKGQNATFVDINSLLTLNDVSSDGIHITSQGYSKIANAWYNSLLPILDPDISPGIGTPRETQIPPTTIEAEALTLTNFAPENPNIPDTQIIGIPFNNGVSTTATATGSFAPPTPGRYDVVLGYYDENDAAGQLQITIGNEVLPAFNLGQNLGSGVIGTQNFVRQTVGKEVLINEATSFTITGTSAFTAQGGGELVRVDYIQFVPINDAPVLNPLLVQNLTAISEDPLINNGNLVSELLGNAVTDLDTGAVLGIAVTEIDNTNGTWQYSIDNANGPNWIDFGTPSAVEARLLGADARIRFVPNLGYSGTPTGITFRAWDQSRGIPGGTVDISDLNAIAGSKPFSEASTTATINVLPVNTVPVANDDSAITNQDTALNIGVLVNDTDADGDALTLSVVTGASNGIASLNNNGTPNNPIDDFITYTPNANFFGVDQLVYQVDDLNGGTDTGTVNITVNPAPNPNPVPDPNPVPNPNPVPGPGTSPVPRPSLIQNPNDTFTVFGPSGQTELQFTLTDRNTGLVNEIGVFVVDDDQGTIGGIAPGAPGYQEAALRNAQVIFSVLPDGLGSANPTRELSFDVGTRLGFYLVQNSTTDSVLSGQAASVFFGSASFNANGTDYLQVSNLTTGGYTLAWNDQPGGGNQNFDDVVLTVQATGQNQPLPVGTELQGGEQRELIDLSDQVGRVTNFNYEVFSEAAYDNTIGLYVVEDQQGTVIDPLSGNRIAPGQVGYEAAAIRRSVFQASEDATGSLQIGGGTLLAPYIIADGTVDEFLTENSGNQQGQGPLAYFAYLGANPDGVDHVRLLGDNTFGFEDLFGGGDRDFNDMVFKVDIVVT